MTKDDARAFDKLITEYHDAFQDKQPLTSARKRRYWDSLIGCSFDRVATGFQRCFETGKYKGLPLPGEIRENMPAYQSDAPFQLEDMRPVDSGDEVKRKIRFTQLCVKRGKIYRTGPEWRTAYENWKQGGGNAV